MKIREISDYLEKIAPLSSQESYDNCGFITGDKNWNLSNALISLDCTEEIVDEAIASNCNLIIAHHPIVFKGLKKITGKNYVEKTLIKAIKNDIAIYAIHTNLDNYINGVNQKIASLLEILNPKILNPKKSVLNKLITYVPTDKIEDVKEALFKAGAGEIGNYSECSFSSLGTGTFKGNENSDPVYGQRGTRSNEAEIKLEVLISTHSSRNIVDALLESHPYEEVAYDLIPIENYNSTEGSGMIGQLKEPMAEHDFLTKLKSVFNCGIIKHTALLDKPIKNVAWCGGSGSFLLNSAKAKKADIYITGDFKYHEFFDAENQIVIADIGHYESEQFTIELIAELITKKIPTFAPCLSKINTNPVKYF